MRRILLLLTVALVMVAMVAVMAVPAFAQRGSNPQGLGKDIKEANCGNYGGDWFNVNRGQGERQHCAK
jgi:hypothetical protein